MKRVLIVIVCLLATLWPATAFSQEATFPFSDQKDLDPQQLKLQKYKMQYLHIVTENDGWQVIRGINEEISDEALLRMMNDTKRLQEMETKAMIGNVIAIGGLLVATAGGVLVSGLVTQDTTLRWGVGIGTLVAGGGLILAGELVAGNVGDEKKHILTRAEAEKLISEYNEKLKKDLGLTDPGTGPIEY